MKTSISSPQETQRTDNTTQTECFYGMGRVKRKRSIFDKFFNLFMPKTAAGQSVLVFRNDPLIR